MSENAARKAQGARLAEARKKAGFRSAREAALRFEWPESTYRAHEGGTRTIGQDDAERYARSFANTSAPHILFGAGEDPVEVRRAPLPPSEISAPFPFEYGRKRLPVYGRGRGGPDDDAGMFVFNGETLAEVLAPPSLEHVTGAYAIYMAGTSMEPRYIAGEVLHINPHKPVRRDDFVVIQLHAGEGEPPVGYVKQFISRSPRETIVRQLNPAPGEEEILHYPTAEVVSIHKIVGTGEG
jgi:phage repressor protein C with HTH and peptisase S24 domain